MLTLDGVPNARRRAWLLGSALALLFTSGASTQESESPPEPQVQWQSVPVFVVSQVEPFDLSWKRNEGLPPRDVAISRQATEEDHVLEIQVSENDGYSGMPLLFRLTTSPSGKTDLQVSGRLASCVLQRGEFVDIHGEVHVERRDGNSPSPFRLSFRIDAIDGQLLDPHHTEGAISLDLSGVAWSDPVASPIYTPPLRSPPLVDLRDAWTFWDQKVPRSYGQVDAAGRRQGTWETWFPNGTLQSRTTFDGGELHGPWYSRTESGIDTTAGQFIHGLRTGTWTQTHYQQGASSDVVITSYGDAR